MEALGLVNNADAAKVLDIVTAYSSSYLLLLEYGFPVIPAGKIFDYASVEQWQELLGDFTALTALLRECSKKILEEKDSDTLKLFEEKPKSIIQQIVDAATEDLPDEKVKVNSNFYSTFQSGLHLMGVTTMFDPVMDKLFPPADENKIVSVLREVSDKNIAEAKAEPEAEAATGKKNGMINVRPFSGPLNNIPSFSNSAVAAGGAYYQMGGDPSDNVVEGASSAAGAGASSAAPRPVIEDAPSSTAGAGSSSAAVAAPPPPPDSLAGICRQVIGASSAEALMTLNLPSQALEVFTERFRGAQEARVELAIIAERDGMLQQIIGPDAPLNMANVGLILSGLRTALANNIQAVRNIIRDMPVRSIVEALAPRRGSLFTRGSPGLAHGLSPNALRLLGVILSASQGRTSLEGDLTADREEALTARASINREVALNLGLLGLAGIAMYGATATYGVGVVDPTAAAQAAAAQAAAAAAASASASAGAGAGAGAAPNPEPATWYGNIASGLASAASTAGGAIASGTRYLGAAALHAPGQILGTAGEFVGSTVGSAIGGILRGATGAPQLAPIGEILAPLRVPALVVAGTVAALYTSSVCSRGCEARAQISRLDIIRDEFLDGMHRSFANALLTDYHNSMTEFFGVMVRYNSDEPAQRERFFRLLFAQGSAEAAFQANEENWFQAAQGINEAGLVALLGEQEYLTLRERVAALIATSSRGYKRYAERFREQVAGVNRAFNPLAAARTVTNQFVSAMSTGVLATAAVGAAVGGAAPAAMALMNTAIRRSAAPASGSASASAPAPVSGSGSAPAPASGSGSGSGSALALARAPASAPSEALVSARAADPNLRTLLQVPHGVLPPPNLIQTITGSSFFGIGGPSLEQLQAAFGALPIPRGVLSAPGEGAIVVRGGLTSRPPSRGGARNKRGASRYRMSAKQKKRKRTLKNKKVKGRANK